MHYKVENSLTTFFSEEGIQAHAMSSDPVTTWYRKRITEAKEALYTWQDFNTVNFSIFNVIPNVTVNIITNITINIIANVINNITANVNTSSATIFYLFSLK